MVNLSRILVTGATGFLGRHVVPVLKAKYGLDAVVGVNSSNYDLLDPAQVHRMFEEIRPTAVIHLAAYSGGIGANRAYPADFYYRNTMLTALIFEVAARAGVSKLLYPMGGCSYPARAASPIGEDQLWCGYPQPESAPYSTAKMMGTVAATSYKTQYGLNTTVIIPGNMYGEYDNYHPLDSHVIPATIRRFHEARLERHPSVIQWGSGTPRRDFVYAGDVAALVPYFLERYDQVGPVNISSGTTTSICELAEMVADMVGYEGKIEWDTTKPDGQMVKIFDVSRLQSLGLSCDTTMAAGLRRTIDWFVTNYEARSDGLRL